MESRTDGRLRDVYEKLVELSVLGSTPALRRALAVVANAVNEELGARIFRRCDPDFPRPGRPIPYATHRGLRSEDQIPFAFREAYYELQQEDRRSSIFLEPVEALAAKLVDYYSGRLEVLEIRGDDEFVGRVRNESRTMAVEHLRSNSPIVSVTTIACDSTAEVVSMLRSLAHSLEKSERSIHHLSATLARDDLPTFGLAMAEQCSLVRVEAGPTRWVNNGADSSNNTARYTTAFQRMSVVGTKPTQRSTAIGLGKRCGKTTGCRTNRPPIRHPTSRNLGMGAVPRSFLAALPPSKRQIGVGEQLTTSRTFTGE